MFGELMKLGLTAKEAETFNYYVTKMLSNVDFDDDPYYYPIHDVPLHQLLYGITLVGK